MLIVGDVGATHCRLALFDLASEQIVYEREYLSQEYDCIEQVLEVFLSKCKTHDMQALCLAVPGPVVDQSCQLTNVAWKKIEIKAIAHHFNLARAFLINDVQGHAWFLVDHHVSCSWIQKSAAQTGNRVFIAVGTGLGEAALFWDGKRYLPFATEGGHCDFSAKDDLQIELVRYLKQQYDHISYEKVLSGQGFINLYAFMRDHQKMTEPLWLKQTKPEQLPHAITTSAIESKEPICCATLDLFLNILGAEVGNCALKYLPFGGIFLGGGISPKILSKLQESIFIESYLDKGRFSSLLKLMPLAVIDDEKSCMKGAGKYAATKLRNGV